jgi:hypothetical protein
MDHIERSRNSRYLDAAPLCRQADALDQRVLNSIWKARCSWTDTGEIELDGTQSIGCNGIETVLERSRKGFRKNPDLHHDGWGAVCLTSLALAEKRKHAAFSFLSF